MIVEKLDLRDYSSQAALDKLNELIEAHNSHVHYAREMNYPTSTPEYPKVHS